MISFSLLEFVPINRNVLLQISNLESGAKDNSFFLYQEGISPSASAVNIVNVKYFIVILTYINKIL